MTRLQTGTFLGHAPTAAIDQDLRSEGRSHGGGYHVEPAGQAAPTEHSGSKSGAYALTEDFLANRGLSENFELAHPLPEGVTRALATATAGASTRRASSEFSGYQVIDSLIHDPAFALASSLYTSWA